MLFPEITTFLESLPNPGNEVTRLAKWNQLAGNLKKEAFNSALSFICTHNARRSVLSQCLAAALAHQHHYTSMRFYSGGAEVTRVHPNTITALEQIGFRLISTEGAAENPIYHLAFSDQAAPLRLFSKEFDHPENQKPYHAILVCSKGDAACPFIPDAASRVLLPFDDPGEYDGTAKAHKAYRYTAEVIASELNYLFQTISR